MKFLLSFLAACALVVSPCSSKEVLCSMSAAYFMSEVDATHVKVVLAVQSRCPDDEQKLYVSREAIVDVTKNPVDGAVLLRAQAEELAKALQADGASVTTKDILDHAQLLKGDPSPSPTPDGTVQI